MRFRVAGRKFGGPAQMLYGLCGATTRNERTPQSNTRFIEIGIDFKRASQLLQTFCGR